MTNTYQSLRTVHFYALLKAVFCHRQIISGARENQLNQFTVIQKLLDIILNGQDSGAERTTEHKQHSAVQRNRNETANPAACSTTTDRFLQCVPSTLVRG